jgi:hypothetical protein
MERNAAQALIGEPPAAVVGGEFFPLGWREAGPNEIVIERDPLVESTDAAADEWIDPRLWHEIKDRVGHGAVGGYSAARAGAPAPERAVAVDHASAAGAEFDGIARRAVHALYGAWPISAFEFQAKVSKLITQTAENVIVRGRLEPERHRRACRRRAVGKGVVIIHLVRAGVDRAVPAVFGHSAARGESRGRRGPGQELQLHSNSPSLPHSGPAPGYRAMAKIAPMAACSAQFDRMTFLGPLSGRKATPAIDTKPWPGSRDMPAAQNPPISAGQHEKV